MSPTSDDQTGQDGIDTLLDVLDRMFPQIGDRVTIYPHAGPMRLLTGEFGGVMLAEPGTPVCVVVFEGATRYTVPWPCTISSAASVE